MEKTTYHILNVAGGYWLDQVEASSPAEALEIFDVKRGSCCTTFEERQRVLRAVAGTYVDVITELELAGDSL